MWEYNLIPRIIPRNYAFFKSKIKKGRFKIFLFLFLIVFILFFFDNFPLKNLYLLVIIVCILLKVYRQKHQYPWSFF